MSAAGPSARERRALRSRTLSTERELAIARAPDRFAHRLWKLRVLVEFNSNVEDCVGPLVQPDNIFERFDRCSKPAGSVNNVFIEDGYLLLSWIILPEQSVDGSSLVTPLPLRRINISSQLVRRQLVRGLQHLRQRFDSFVDFSLPFNPAPVAAAFRNPPFRRARWISVCAPDYHLRNWRLAGPFQSGSDRASYAGSDC